MGDYESRDLKNYPTTTTLENKAVKEMKPKVTQVQVDRMFADSVKLENTVGNKTTVVVCELPNGFVIVESSSCVHPENYDFELGKEICYKRIKDKIWELEGYLLQQSVFEGGQKKHD